MSWDSVNSSKATEKQIKYAETLLEAYYGDINFPIYTMSSRDISELIDDVKKKCQEKGIEYHNTNTISAERSTINNRQPTIRRNDYFGTVPYYPIFDEFHNDVHTPAVSQMIRSEEELEQIIEEIDRSAIMTTVDNRMNQNIKVNFSWRDYRKVVCVEIQNRLNLTLEIISRQRQIFVRETAMQEQRKRERDRELINNQWRLSQVTRFNNTVIQPVGIIRNVTT